LDASCGGAGKVQAGGYGGPVPNGGSYAIRESFRTGRKTWRTTFTPAAGLSLQTYAYCAKTGAPSTSVGSTTASGFGLHTATSAPCKRGTRPVSGGFSQPGFISNDNLFQMNESLRFGKSWMASGTHQLNTLTLNAFAYCA
jgi:hypothetical protein